MILFSKLENTVKIPLLFIVLIRLKKDEYTLAR